MNAQHILPVLAAISLAACQPTSTPGESTSSSSSSGGAQSGASSGSGMSSGTGGTSTSTLDGGATSTSDGGVVINPGDGGVTLPDAGPPSNATQDVYTRLRPTCAACHAAGANLPFFDSLGAFQSLLVADPRFVVPGEPDQSSLVNLLMGNNVGTWRQMPLGPSSFLQLEMAGQTGITVVEIRAWIEGLLPTMMGDPTPDPAATTMRRMTVEQIVASLYQELGIDEMYDIRSGPDDRGSRNQSFDVRSRHEPLRQWSNAPYDRFEKLGGPNWFTGRRRSQELTPAFLQYFTQLTQTWCHISIGKSVSPLFVNVGRDSPSSTHEADIRMNIRTMHLRLLGDPATDEDVNALYSIFTGMEPGGTRRAWLGVCSALLRDPRWVLY